MVDLPIDSHTDAQSGARIYTYRLSTLDGGYEIWDLGFHEGQYIGKRFLGKENARQIDYSPMQSFVNNMTAKPPTAVSADQRVSGNMVDHRKSSLMKCESNYDCADREVCARVNGHMDQKICMRP